MQYRVLNNVMDSGKLHKHGTVLNETDIDAKTAADLLERGAIEKVEDTAQPSGDGDSDPAGSSGEGDGKSSLLDKAKGMFNKGGKDLTLNDAYEMILADLRNGSITEEAAYTNAGKPDCGMLAKYIKRDVLAAERDAWWETVQKAANQ